MGYCDKCGEKIYGGVEYCFRCLNAMCISPDHHNELRDLPQEVSRLRGAIEEFKKAICQGHEASLHTGTVSHNVHIDLDA